jgi:hypothetical protein
VGKLRKNQELQGKVKKIIRSGAIVELLDLMVKKKVS